MLLFQPGQAGTRQYPDKREIYLAPGTASFKLFSSAPGQDGSGEVKGQDQGSPNLPPERRASRPAAGPGKATTVLEKGQPRLPPELGPPLRGNHSKGTFGLPKGSVMDLGGRGLIPYNQAVSRRRVSQADRPKLGI